MNDSAFPFGVRVIRRDGYGGGEITVEDNAPGMSLRDYFAAKAMQALMADQVGGEATAKDAYFMADAMLKAREA